MKNMGCVSKIGSMFLIVTNGVITTDTDVVFGIHPSIWRSLPCEGIALLKIRQEVPTAGAALPASIAVPTSSTVSTIGDASSCCTVQNIPLVDPMNVALVGDDLVNGTERLLYFNKIRGVLRIMDCCKAAAAPTPAN